MARQCRDDDAGLLELVRYVVCQLLALGLASRCRLLACSTRPFNSPSCRPADTCRITRNFADLSRSRPDLSLPPPSWMGLPLLHPFGCLKVHPSARGSLSHYSGCRARLKRRTAAAGRRKLEHSPVVLAAQLVGHSVKRCRRQILISLTPQAMAATRAPANMAAGMRTARARPKPPVMDRNS